jgi:iron-sulfur cluster repair protein YtfE (RIC family)
MAADRAPGEDHAYQAILDHHTELARELDSRVTDVVTQAVDPGEARRALLGFLHDELLPHAAAEERTLYPAAARDPSMAPLVQAMTDEHKALAGRVSRLDTVTDPTVLAAEIRALFEVHVHKEDHYLLPALSRAEIDLVALLHDTHHLLAGD